MGSDSSDLFDSLCLVGFMGSGKSTVGRLLADRLGWVFVDLDREIESVTGKSVTRMFAESGEVEFRKMEAELGLKLVGRPRTVLATGGGWGAVAGRLESLHESVCTVWLQVSPEVAVDRIRLQAPVRPLLHGASDPLWEARSLLAIRAPQYEAARFHVDTSGREVTEVVSAVLKHMRSGHRTRPS